MNKIFRRVYNEALGVWVTVSELSKRRGKGSKRIRTGAALSALVTAGLGFAMPGGAWAGCTWNSGTNTYDCSNATYLGISLPKSGDHLSAGTSFTVSITSSYSPGSNIYDNALSVKNAGSGTVTIISKGKVQNLYSGGTALEATIDSSGKSLDIIQQSGSFTGLTYGINATQNANAKLSIDTYGTVTGGTAAINATHNGEGTLEIDTSGKVTSLLGTGIVATHTADSSGDLIIRTYSSGSVYGSVAGINATQDGGDDLKIYTDGAVSSSLLGIGVKATNNGTGALSIDTREGGTVTGGVAGIYATNNGQNSTTSINTSGKVEGSYTPLLGPTIYLGAGIYAVQGTDAGSLTITEASTGSITGGLAGILAVNQGNSTTTVTISGSVEARGIESADSLSSILNNISDLGNSGSLLGVSNLLGGVGIGVVNGTTTTGLTINQDTATSTISGGAFGILAYNDGKGAAANVITSGKVDSDGVGIAVINGSDAGDLNINQQSSSVITGGMIGIGAVNDGTGITSIVTSGEVKEASFAGITATNGGSTGGLFIEQMSGSITGGVFGIEASTGSGNLSIIQENLNPEEESSIIGGAAGILAVNNGTGITSIVTSGTVEGNGLEESNSIFSGIVASAGTLTDISLSEGTELGGVGIGVLNGTNSTGLSIDQVSGSISGGLAGIVAVNGGSGTTDITTLGTVTGDDFAGIVAWNGSDTTGLTINQQSRTITGGLFGILAYNDGSSDGNAESDKGATANVITSGVVESDGVGVAVINGSNAGDLNINQQDGKISGDVAGIVAVNAGTGITSIVTSGVIESEVDPENNLLGDVVSGFGELTDISDLPISTELGGVGIVAVNGSDTTGLMIKQQSGIISGDVAGILAYNNGSSDGNAESDKGATANVITSGVVESDGVGVAVINGSNAGDLNINQQGGTISGDVAGIVAVNAGTGITSIVTSGDVVSEGYTENGLLEDVVSEFGELTDIPDIPISTELGGVGIVAVNGSEASGLLIDQMSGSISGDLAGIVAVNVGSGTTDITTSSTVTGDDFAGIVAWNGSDTTGLTINQQSGTISGGVFGILAYNDGSSDGNAESDRGATANVITSGVVESDGVGVAVINGSDAGDLNINQQGGTISGDVAGIVAVNAGTGITSIVTSGDVVSEGYTENGLLEDVVSGFGELTDIPISTELGGVGIVAVNGSEASGLLIDQMSGSISGDLAGIVAVNVGTGITGIVTSGVVEGSDFAGITAINGDSTNGLFIGQMSGSITGGTVGILATSTGTDGMIVNQLESGTITGGSTGIWLDNEGTGATSITTAGTVVGTDEYGIGVVNGITASSLTIGQTAGSSITGGAMGINAVNQGSGLTTITTSGTISGTEAAIYSESVSGYVVQLNSGSVVTASDPVNGTIHIVDASSGTIDIAAGATLTAPGHDTTVIRDGDKNNDGVDEIGGSMVVTTYGNVTGTAVLGGGNDTFNLLGGDWNGNIYLDDYTDGPLDGSDVFNWTGGDLHSGVYGGGGDDTFNISSPTYDGSQILDGGSGKDVLNFTGITATTPGSYLPNWEIMNLDDTSLTITGGSLTVGDGSSDTGVYLTNGSYFTGGAIFTMNGNLSIDGTSTFSAMGDGTGNVTLNGNLTNNGTVTMQNGLTGDQFTVNGNYSGTGGYITMDALLQGGTAVTDTMIINGTATGVTKVYLVTQYGSATGSAPDGSSMFLEVTENVADGSFDVVTPSPLQQGAYEYYVNKVALSTGGAAWFLSNHIDFGPTLYRPGVVNYSVGQQINNEQGLLQLSTYHQRIGGQYMVDDEGRRTWLRPYYTYQSADGATRFQYDGTITGVQAGQEVFMSGRENGGADRFSVTLDYSMAKMDIYDRLRPYAGKSMKTGDMDGYSLALGGTWTRTDKEDGYLDVVAQVSALKNDFDDSYGAGSTQRGWRGALSVEVGKPMFEWNKWQLEPQAQLSYLHTDYRSFDDDISNIDGYNTDALVARVGGRVFRDFAFNDGKSLQVYAIGNVLQNLTNTSSLQVDDASVGDDFSRTRGQVGTGVAWRLGKNFYSYADARYEHSLSSEDTSGYELNAGIRIKF